MGNGELPSFSNPKCERAGQTPSGRCGQTTRPRHHGLVVVLLGKSCTQLVEHGAPEALGQRQSLRACIVKTNTRDCRLGVLSMILGFALGIANIFTFNIVIIIFCALLL